MINNLNEKLDLLPEDIRELVLGMPPDEAAALMEKLIKPVELSYAALSEKDVDTIKIRTVDTSAYGFLSVDVDFTWDELQRPGYVALGAFDENQDGEAVPVAFIIAEVSKLNETQEFYWEQQARTDNDGDGNIGTPMPQDNSVQGKPMEASDDPEGKSGVSGAVEMQKLLEAGGWSPTDIILSIYYIGVDFEYRRQGVGKQLLDLLKEIAKGARARFMWLNVAEYNPTAISFYLNYGFKKTEEFKKGERGNHYLFVYPLSGDKPTGSGHSKARSKSKKKSVSQIGKGRGFGVAPLASIKAPLVTASLVSSHIHRADFVCREMKNAGAQHWPHVGKPERLCAWSRRQNLGLRMRSLSLRSLG